MSLATKVELAIVYPTSFVVLLFQVELLFVLMTVHVLQSVFVLPVLTVARLLESRGAAELLQEPDFKVCSV